MKGPACLLCRLGQGFIKTIKSTALLVVGEIPDLLQDFKEDLRKNFLGLVTTFW